MTPCRFDAELAAFAVLLPSGVGAAPIKQSTSGGTAAAAQPSGGSSTGPVEFYLHPAAVRRADSSAASVNEWTGERLSRDADVAEDVKPASVAPLGNYAVRSRHRCATRSFFLGLRSFEGLE